MQFILTQPVMAREVARYNHNRSVMSLTRAFEEATRRTEASRGTLEFTLLDNQWNYRLDCFSSHDSPWKTQDTEEPLMPLVRRARFKDGGRRLSDGLPHFPWAFLPESVSFLYFRDLDLASVVLGWGWANLTSLTLDVYTTTYEMNIKWPVTLKKLKVIVAWKSFQDPVFSGLPPGLEVLIFDGRKASGMQVLNFKEKLPSSLRVLMIKVNSLTGHRFSRVVRVVPEEDFPSLEETNVVYNPGDQSYYCPRVKKSLHALDGDGITYFPMPGLQRLSLSHFSSFEDRDGRKDLPLLAPNVTFLSEVHFLESCSCSFSKLKYLNVDHWDMRYGIKELPKTLEGFQAKDILTRSKGQTLDLTHFPDSLKILIASFSARITEMRLPKNLELCVLKVGLCVLKVQDAHGNLRLEIPDTARWFFVNVWNSVVRSQDHNLLVLDVNRQPIYSRLSFRHRMVIVENLIDHPHICTRNSSYQTHQSSGKGPEVPEPEDLDEARELLELAY